MKKLPVYTLVLFAVIASLQAEVTYQKPPRQILDVLHAPAPPQPSLNPSRTHILLMERRLYPPIEEVAAPMLRLAGMRVNPANNGERLPYTVATGLTIKEIASGVERKIAVPGGARLVFASWSPDGAGFAVLNYTETGVELYLGSTTSQVLKKVNGILLNDADGNSVIWLGGSKELLVKTVVATRGQAPKAPKAPVGPNVQESQGKAAGVWTYQDLLKSPYDEALFEYYFTSQLVVVEVAAGKVTRVGKPAVFLEASPAPDGRHLFVSRVTRPYSYLLTWSEFPQEMEVWDRSGRLVHKLHSAAVQDSVPVDGVPTGPRNASWQPTEPATLLWWEALDGGDPKVKVPHRDRLMLLEAPFSAQPVEVMRTEHRAMGLTHGEAGLALVRDYDREKRWTNTYRVSVDKPGAEIKVVWSRSINDRYKDPGFPVTRRLPTGGSVMVQNAGSIFLTGPGATPEGDRPFLDRMNLESLQTERLFQAGEKGYETVLALLADDASKFLTSYESPSEPPNLFIRSAANEERKAVTAFADPTPQLRTIQQKRVVYTRPDGVQLSFTLLLPPDYKEGTRLPTILYAYPLEYNDPNTAGQIGGSTQRFVSMRGASHLFLLLAGYAILNNATIPIVGDFETVNNTYIEQLVAGAKAAIDKAAEMGVTDPTRVGVTGHSYGGFMTANLLAHSDLFKTGVARSGAYNRTLTPFGFQSERRTFWQARDIYLKMSPFAYADKINEPLLLIHGEADNNSGTFPIQSERLYQAVRGHGGTVRLVMLPHESHGYTARESIEHVIWETQEWFDRYLKGGQVMTSR